MCNNSLQSAKENYWEYQLVYIDDNDIPELYMKGMPTAQGDRLISIHHGEIVETDLYNYGFLYIEKSGLFCDSGGHMDSYYDTVYSMNDGAVKVLESGSFGGGIDEIGEPDYQYFWNDEEMSEAEYQERLSQVFEKDDASKGYDFNLMNKNEIIDSLIRL